MVALFAWHAWASVARAQPAKLTDNQIVDKIIEASPPRPNALNPRFRKVHVLSVDDFFFGRTFAK